MSNARNLANLLGTGTQITTADIADGAFQANKNLIINGSCAIAQRGTSQTAAGYGTIDRYYLALSGATATMTQESFSTSDRNSLGFEKYLKLAVSTANNNSGIYYRIEANDVVHLIGSKATFSFYAKGTNPAGGSFQTKPQWYNNSSGGGDNGVAQSLTVTSTWTRYSFTFDIPTPSNTTIDTNAYLGFEILQPAGDTSTTAWELNTTGWQVEAGETATPFEHEDIGTTLAKCQRYYYYSGFGFNNPGGTDSGSTDYEGQIFSVHIGSNRHTFFGSFPVFLRGIPALTFYSPHDGASANAENYTGGGNISISASYSRSRQGLGGYSQTSTSGDTLRAYVEADAEI